MKISFVLFASRILYVVLHKQYKMFEKTLAIEAVLRLNCFIFDKILKGSCSSEKKISTKGEIINYILVDSARLIKITEYTPMLLIAPIQIVVYSYLLLDYLGISFIFGLLIVVMSFILNYFIYRDLPALQRNFLSLKDDRLKKTSEALDNIKLLKMYSWEGHFESEVNNL